MSFYNRLLNEEFNDDRVLRVPHSSENVSYLIEYLLLQDDCESSEGIYALESNEGSQDNARFSVWNTKAAESTKSARYIPDDKEDFEVIDGNLIVQRKTITRQARYEGNIRKFYLFTANTIVNEELTCKVQSVFRFGNGKILVTVAEQVPDFASKGAVLDFGIAGRAFLALQQTNGNTFVVAASSMKTGSDTSLHHVDTPDIRGIKSVSILRLNQTKSVLHIVETSKTLKNEISLNAFVPSSVPTEDMQDLTRDAEFGTNEVGVAFHRMGVNKAIKLLFKQFGEEEVKNRITNRMEIDGQETTTTTGVIKDLLTETQVYMQRQPSLGTHSLESFCPLDSTSEPNCVQNTHSLEPNTSRKSILKTIPASSKKFSLYRSDGFSLHSSQSEAAIRVFETSDLKSNCHYLGGSGIPETQSTTSYQTQETIIRELCLPELIKKTMQEATQQRNDNVAIVVSDAKDGKHLRSWLKQETFQAKLMKNTDFATIQQYETCLKNNQAVIFCESDWKTALTDEDKSKIKYLIIALQPGNTDSSLSIFAGSENLTSLESASFSSEEMPITSQSLPVMASEPLAPNTSENHFEMRSSAQNAPAVTPWMTETRTCTIQERPLHQTVLDCQMYQDLQKFIKDTITDICQHVNQLDEEQQLYPISNQDYSHVSNFANMFINWIIKAEEKVGPDDPRLWCLKEAHKAILLVYLIGVENIKILAFPAVQSISKITASERCLNNQYHGTVQKLKTMLSPQLSTGIVYTATRWLETLVNCIREGAEEQSFHGLIRVYDRNCIWATSEMLKRNQELQHVEFMAYYSSVKDKTAYNGGTEVKLRMSTSERTIQMNKFKQSNCAVIVTVELNNREAEEIIFDYLIHFGTRSEKSLAHITARKECLIKEGHSTQGIIRFKQSEQKY